MTRANYAIRAAMIVKFPCKVGEAIFECEQRIIGREQIQQSVYVKGIGHIRDPDVYGIGKTPESEMAISAERLAFELISSTKL